MTLEKFFKQNSKLALGFSGGVDSAFLLYAGKQNGADIVPYYVKTPFSPEFEYNDAKKLCGELGVKLRVIEVDLLQNDRICDNHSDRCYLCKKMIFLALCENALADGYSVIIDGTNASDNPNDRAGMKALEELHVKSPLRECGITKGEVRRLSKIAQLFTWDKPSYSCLATRIMTDTKITSKLLETTEGAENALMSLGFEDFRVRNFHGCAKLEFKKSDFEKVFLKLKEIKISLKPYYENILLDLDGR